MTIVKTITTHNRHHRKMPALNSHRPTSNATLPWIVIIFFSSLLQPSITSVYLGDLRLTIYRLVLLGTLIPCLSKVFSRQVGPVKPCDILIVTHCIWVIIALAIVHDPLTALKTGGIYFVEAAGAYFLGRCYIRSLRQFRGFVRLYVLLVAALAFVTIPECITGKHFFNPGQSDIERRFGLARSFGPFDHPILLGVFCASAIGLSWYTLGHDHRITFRRLARLGLLATAAVTSVSSGAVAAIMSQLVLIGWDRGTHKRRRRWFLFLGILICCYIFIACASSRTPMTVMLYYLTFNAETAYGRITIWEFGSASVMKFPIFGIGMNSWDHPTWISDSVDNFWLCTAMMYGIPAFFMLAGSIAYLLIKLFQTKRLSAEISRARMGWLVSIAGLIISGCTVHFWNSIFVLLFFLLGSGVWMLDTEQMQQKG